MKKKYFELGLAVILLALSIYNITTCKTELSKFICGIFTLFNLYLVHIVLKYYKMYP